MSAPVIDKLYSWMVHGPTPDVDRLLAAALEEAEPAWRSRMFGVLSRRGLEASWAALLGCYDDLPDEIRATIARDEPRRQAALALALKLPSERQRCSALRALLDFPSPRLSYALSGLLRDRSEEVRTGAAQALRRIGETVARQRLNPASDPEARSREIAERRELAASLRDALRGFNVHRRVEVLEVGLWFAQEVGDVLWGLLNSTRSRARIVVTERFWEWESSHLAGFLLIGLKHFNWRSEAQRMLERWNGDERVAALLACTDLLEDREIRERVVSQRNPDWFDRPVYTLRGIPEPLRVRAPEWVLALYREREAVQRLSNWARGEDPAVRRAAVDMLTRAGHAEAASVALTEAPLADDGSHDDAPDPGPRAGLFAASAAPADVAAEGVPAQDEDPDGELRRLWHCTQGAAPEVQGLLVELLRQAAGGARAFFEAQLGSARPRDRLLALRVIGTAGLAGLYRSRIAELVDDPLPGLRRLAEQVARALDGLPDDGPPETSPGGPSETAVVAGARAVLRQGLDRLGADGAAALDADSMEGLGQALRAVYGPGEPVTVPEERT